MIRKRYLLISLLILGVTLVVASQVSAADELEIFAGQDKTVRVNTPLDFNDAEITKPNPLDPERTYTFSWDFDNKKDTSLDDPPIYDNDAESNERYTEWTYHMPDTYIVTLTVEDGFKTVKDTLQVKVIANVPPDIHVNETEQAFKDVEHIFYGEATDDNDLPYQLRWHWEFGDGESSDDAPPVRHTYGSVRGYQVKVRVIDYDNDISDVTIYLNVIEKPGLMGQQFNVEDGKTSEKAVQIREEGYVFFKLPASNNHEIIIEVVVSTTPPSPPVAVLIFTSENAFLDYELGVGGTWKGSLSHEELDYLHLIAFTAEGNGDYYIVIDNGYQTGGGFGSFSGMATVDVKVEDLDHGNWFADIPIYVYFVIVVIIAVVVLFIVGNKFLEMQHNQKQRKQAIVETKVQKDQAVSSLRSFLNNPEDATVRASQRAQMAPQYPQPGPGGPPGGPGPAPMPGPGPTPVPGGMPMQTRPQGAPGGPPPQRPAGAPGGPPPQRPAGAPGGPPPQAPPQAPPMDEPVDTGIPTTFESPPIVEAPAIVQGDAPEMIASSGPVYLSTEQPKRESTDFNLRSEKDIAADFELKSEKEVAAEDERSKTRKRSEGKEASEAEEETESSEEE